MSWEMKSLDQLGYVSRGRSRHRPRDAAHLYGGPYPFIQTSDVKHAGLYLTEYSQTYSEEGLAQSRLWKSGTLCITIAANIADTAILDIDACFPDSVIGFIPDKDKADVRFVKYLFDSHLQRSYKKFTQGAAQDNLSQGKLLSLKFPIPGINEQRDIADKISVYDDLIENNRRRIQLLEQAARLLYKEWFVRLHFPGYEHVTINDGVPEGWEKKKVKDVLVKVKRPRKIKKEDFLEEGPFPCVDQSRDFIGGYTDDEEAIITDFRTPLNRHNSLQLF
jgi:type I restriction enzyme S subunit